MAGGHGGLEFLRDGTIWKQTNATERDFYLSIYEDRGQEAWALKPACTALEDFVPGFYGHRDELGVPSIRISNLARGIANPKIMDVKIGARTASKAELKHTGMSTFGAWKKRRKLQMADWWTKSGDRGYRVVDDGSVGSRADLARRDTTEVFSNFFEDSVLRLQNASHGVLRLARAMCKLNNVFISSSVLFCFDPRDASGAVRLVLIDFGHTHQKGAVSGLNEAKYAEYFKTGLSFLSRDLADAQDAVDFRQKLAAQIRSVQRHAARRV